MSFINERDPLEIPKSMLLYALGENSRNKRGFWALNHYEESGKYILEYMHNIAGALLIPDDFDKICRAVARKVDEIERMLIK